MKRHANTHCKIKTLAKKLKIHQFGAVGLMENLWHWAAEEVPDGGVGKYPDEIIADSMMWPWPKKAHLLIEALVDAGFLDEMSGCRLYIHDWHEHCEDSVNKKIARKGLLFANGKGPSLSSFDTQEKQRIKRLYDGGEPTAGAQKPTAGAQKPTAGAQKPTASPLPMPMPMPMPEPCSPHPLMTGEEEGKIAEEEAGPEVKKWREVYRILKESPTLSLLTYDQVVKACRAFPDVDLLAEAKKMAAKSGLAVNGFPEPGMWVYSWLQKSAPEKSKKNTAPRRTFDPKRDLENGP